jgi:hypothetical protein
MTSAVVAASGYSGKRVWLFVVAVWVVPDDEYQLVMLDDRTAAFL